MINVAARELKDYVWAHFHYSLRTELDHTDGTLDIHGNEPPVIELLSCERLGSVLELTYSIMMADDLEIK